MALEFLNGIKIPAGEINLKGLTIERASGSGATGFDNDALGSYILSPTDGAWGAGTKPAGSHNGVGILSFQTHTGNYYTQLALSTNTNDLFIRSANASETFGDYNRLWNDSHFSTTDVTNWGTAYTHSQATHAPTDAEANVQADWTATSGDALILNKPTIPSGNSILDWTTDQGSTNIHANNIVGYINSTEPNEPFNPFAGQKFHDGVLTNALAGRHDRFVVTIDGTVEAGASWKLSNQAFEEYNQNRLFGTSAGETKVFNINVQSLATGSPSTNGITYSAGFFDINFYSIPFPASWSARVKNKDGNWTTVTSLNKIGNSKLRGVIPIGNYLTDIEFTLTARTSAPFVTGNITYGISEFELFFSRMSSSQGGNISSIGGYLGGVITTASGTTSTNWNTAYTHSQATHAPTDAEANVQADWSATSGDALILNKPTIPTVPDSYAPTDAEANVQADWNETTTTSDAFILNKPTIPTDHGDHDGLYLPIGGGTLTGPLTIAPASGLNSVLNINGNQDSFIEKDTGNTLYIANNANNQDIKFRVKDNSTNVVALTLDGSENGNALFAGQVKAANVFIADDVDVTNAVPASGNARFSGYGLNGNRGTFYITNGGGTVQIGNGATHNANATATFSTTLISFARDTFVGTKKYTLTVNAPTVLTTTIVNSTINVGFTASTTTNIDYYLVFSSVSGGDYGLISVIPPADFGATMSIIDNTFDATGTQAYRVYAVKNGVYSAALTGSEDYAVTSAEPTNMSVVNLNTAYYVQWDPPSANARFITAYNVYKHEHATQGSLDRDSATLIYSGLNTSYMYQISGSNNINYHQFWVETTIG